MIPQHKFSFCTLPPMATSHLGGQRPSIQPALLWGDPFSLVLRETSLVIVFSCDSPMRRMTQHQHTQKHQIPASICLHISYLHRISFGRVSSRMNDTNYGHRSLDSQQQRGCTAALKATTIRLIQQNLAVGVSLSCRFTNFCFLRGNQIGLARGGLKEVWINFMVHWGYTEVC